MLHALDDNGVEVFGYIPASLFSTDAGAGLHYLSDPSYIHRYYVDLSPTVQDAYIKVGGTNRLAYRPGRCAAWRRQGPVRHGRHLSSALASNAAGNVMWEFSHNDLGYTFSDIQIGKMNNGKWAAVFGNGYNNDPNGDGRQTVCSLPGWFQCRPPGRDRDRRGQSGPDQQGLLRTPTATVTA